MLLVLFLEIKLNYITFLCKMDDIGCYVIKILTMVFTQEVCVLINNSTQVYLLQR